MWSHPTESSLPISDNPEARPHSHAFPIVSEQRKTRYPSNHFADLLAQAGQQKKKTHCETGKVGVRRGVGSGRGGLSFHCIRHTAVPLMKDAGIPEAAVMELIEQDSKQMSENYVYVGRDALRAVGSLRNNADGGGREKGKFNAHR